MELTKPTMVELLDHLRAGDILDNGCPVCGHKWAGEWTDLNGEQRCWQCGVAIQVKNHKIKEEWCQAQGISTDEIKTPYCSDFHLLPLRRLYWQATHHRIPDGDYFGDRPDPREVWLNYWRWIAARHVELQPIYPDEILWDKLLANPELNGEIELGEILDI
jgi:hypothetical protein